MEGLLRFFEKLARQLEPQRLKLRVVGFIGMGGLLESLWLGEGLHQLLYFTAITWGFGLSLLVPIYYREGGEESWIGKTSEIVQSTMAFFTALWYVILIILSISILIKLAIA